MEEVFKHDERLGLEVPELDKAWMDYSREQRLAILEHWESMRGRIPHLIGLFEAEIHTRQDLLHEEDDWDKTVALLNEINDYASRINDLNILYRTQPDVDVTSESTNDQ